MSGADMQAVCSGAMMKAIEREVRKAETLGEDSDVTGGGLQITLDDFKKSLVGVKPSISEEELLHFKRLRVKFEK
ncbi:hypothetical protein J437_LFUL004245 [Ladona fulva]|uniref:Spastin/Vps4 C-terminal domain-containing protein n=1 Tax=Ladona fulva TaxID=123851 RepID=A0A8K0NZC3_LADFU|nr:hypothetical protein J437_LFUL004245 [Ladona fulva]